MAPNQDRLAAAAARHSKKKKLRAKRSPSISQHRLAGRCWRCCCRPWRRSARRHWPAIRCCGGIAARRCRAMVARIEIEQAADDNDGGHDRSRDTPAEAIIAGDTAPIIVSHCHRFILRLAYPVTRSRPTSCPPDSRTGTDPSLIGLLRRDYHFLSRRKRRVGHASRRHTETELSSKNWS